MKPNSWNHASKPTMTKPGSPAVQPVETIGKERGDTKKAGQDDAATMCRLPFWCHDKGDVSHQRQQFKLTSVQSNKTRKSCVSGSNDLIAARIHHPAQPEADLFHDSHL
jgi:hypothetical protein